MKKLRKMDAVLIKKEIDEPVVGIRGILKKNWKFLTVLLVGVIGIYFNSLWGAFVSDDYATISQNPQIMDFKSSLVGWMSGVINWLLAVTFDIKSPIPFHITSLLLYLAVIVAAFVLLEVIFKNNLVSKITVIIFAFFPVHVEAVSWIAGRPYLLNALFVLISLTVFALYTKTLKKKYIYWFLFLTVLTFAAEKTRSTALLLLCFLFWISFENKLKNKVSTGKILAVLFSLFLIALVVLWPSLMARISSVNTGVNVSESIFYNPFFQYPTAISKYLQLIFFPVDLTLYHTMFISPVWINWLVFLTYLTLLAWFWFKERRYFFALAFIFLAAAPSMAPVKISWLVAERYVFLGSLGAALLLGLLAERYWNKKVLVLIGLSVLVGGYGARIFLRNIDWQTNHNLWVNTCQVSPNSHNAWNNIGDDYDKLAQLETTDEARLRQYENAIKGFGMSYQIKQNYADAYHNQANIFYKIGRLDLARAGYEKAISYNSGLYQTYLTLVQIDLMEQNKTELLKHLTGLNQSRPNDLQVAYMTATAYARIGMLDEAKQLATAMYQQLPNVAEVRDLYNSLNQLVPTESSKSAVTK